MSVPQSVFKLPFRFDHFAFNDAQVLTASLVDANGCVCRQGDLIELMNSLPLKKALVKNWKFAKTCVQDPERSIHARPYHLHAKFGTGERSNILHVELHDNHGNVLLSDDLAGIAAEVAKYGLEVSRTSVHVFRKVVDAMRPHQHIDGVADKKIPPGIARYSV